MTESTNCGVAASPCWLQDDHRTNQEDVCSALSNDTRQVAHAHYHDQTRSLLRKDEQLFVETQAFHKAVHSLTQNGLVLLAGPPGCGKSTTARALLRHFQKQNGLIPLVLTDYQEWRQHIGEGNQVIVLLDNIFGDVFFARKQFDKWSNVFPVILDFARAGKCMTVFTMYHHILTEARSCTVSDNLFRFIPCVDFHHTVLSYGERNQMISSHMHTQHFPERGQDLNADILSVDSSGPVFPWCISKFIKRCSKGQSTMSVFRQPALSYRGLLLRSLKNEQHGQCLASALLLEVGKAYRESWDLGHMFQRSCIPIRPCIYHSRSSLSEQLRQLFNHSHDQPCTDQHLRAAAGLALACSDFGDLLLEHCDLRFLTDHVGVDASGFCGCVKLDRMSPLYQSFHRRVYTELMLGHLPEMCAHPMMQRKEYLQDFHEFCMLQRLPLHDILAVSDPYHKENLLYWSAFCPSPDLTAWCAGHMLSSARDKTNISACLQRVLLVSVMSGDKLFSQKIRCLVSLIQQVSAEPLLFTESVLLPFPKETDFTEDLAVRCTHLKRHGSYYLYYLFTDEYVPIDGVKVLLNNVASYFRLQMSPLHMFVAIRTLLANRRIGVHEQDKDGNTFLHLAAQYGNADAVKLAVRKGSSLTVRNNMGLRPPDLARSCLQLERTKSGSKLVDKDSLGSACREGNLTRVKTLLCLSSTVSCVDQSGNTPLHCACERGQVSIASLLLELGAEVNARNKNGSTPLHLACRHGFQETVELLLEQGADPDTADASGIRPLHIASHLHHRFIILVLLYHDADINVKTVDGHSPLHLACIDGGTGTVKQLIEQNAKLNIKDNLGYTPLHQAVLRGYEEAVDLLCACGASTLVKTVDGSTPFDFAVQYERGRIYLLLRSYWAKKGKRQEDFSGFEQNDDPVSHSSAVSVFQKSSAVSKKTQRFTNARTGSDVSKISERSTSSGACSVVSQMNESPINCGTSSAVPRKNESPANSRTGSVVSERNERPGNGSYVSQKNGIPTSSGNGSAVTPKSGKPTNTCNSSAVSDTIKRPVISLSGSTSQNSDSAPSSRDGSSQTNERHTDSVPLTAAEVGGLVDRDMYSFRPLITRTFIREERKNQARFRTRVMHWVLRILHYRLFLLLLLLYMVLMAFKSYYGS